MFASDDDKWPAIVQDICEVHATGRPVLVVAGEVMAPLPPGVEGVSLTERFGGERSRLDTPACIQEVVRDHLTRC